MTRARPDARGATGRGASTRADAFVGTWVLVRLMLRRDRIRLPAWTVGISAFWIYITQLVPTVYGDAEDLRGIGEVFGGPMARMLVGPAYGFDELTIEVLMTGAYGLYALLLVALMNLLLIVRHTRADEERRRIDLVRASVVGRQAPLCAAFVVALVTNLVVVLALGAVSLAAPELRGNASILFVVGVGLAGSCFAGVAALAAQLTAFSRAAAGLAGGVLGAAFLVRALGDMAAPGGSWVSWLSPLAWPQQTAPFVLDRWWPLSLSVVFTIAGMLAALAISSRRDVDSGVIGVRAGRDGAPGWLRSPLALAYRLQRASLIGWTCSLVVAGAVFGAWVDQMRASFDDLPDVLIDVTGGTDDVVAGYLGLMALMMAQTVAVFGVLAIQSQRSEESGGRVEPVLATPVGRPVWLGSHVAVAAIGALAMLIATGIATGAAAGVVTGDAGLVWDVAIGHAAHAPAVWTVMALAALMYGVAPRWIGLAWALLVHALLVGVFGPLLDLPSWVNALSPFEHVARYPLEPLRWGPLVVLTSVATAIAAAALAGFRRRDLTPG